MWPQVLTGMHALVPMHQCSFRGIYWKAESTEYRVQTLGWTLGLSTSTDGHIALCKGHKSFHDLHMIFLNN